MFFWELSCNWCCCNWCCNWCRNCLQQVATGCKRLQLSPVAIVALFLSIYNVHNYEVLRGDTWRLLHPSYSSMTRRDKLQGIVVSHKHAVTSLLHTPISTETKRMVFYHYVIVSEDFNCIPKIYSHNIKWAVGYWRRGQQGAFMEIYLCSRHHDSIYI